MAEVDPDDTKCSVLGDLSEMPGEAFTPAAFHSIGLP